MKILSELILFAAVLAFAFSGKAQNRATAPQSDLLFDTNILGKTQTAATSDVRRPATLFATPVILVTPAALDFGTVVTNKSATNTFLVENAGGGKLRGTAKVQAPFAILDGGSYSLAHNEIQVVTIGYTPKRYTGSNDVQTVSFSGAGGAKARVIGRPLAEKPRVYPRAK